MHRESERERVLKLLKNEPVFTARQAMDNQIHRTTLQRMAEHGEIIRLKRGVYSGSGDDASPHRTILEAITQVPEGILCLLSVLRFHEIGTQNPHEAGSLALVVPGRQEFRVCGQELSSFPGRRTLKELNVCGLKGLRYGCIPLQKPSRTSSSTGIRLDSISRLRRFGRHCGAGSRNPQRS